MNVSFDRMQLENELQVQMVVRKIDNDHTNM